MSLNFTWECVCVCVLQIIYMWYVFFIGFNTARVLSNMTWHAYKHISNFIYFVQCVYSVCRWGMTRRKGMRRRKRKRPQNKKLLHLEKFSRNMKMIKSGRVLFAIRGALFMFHSRDSLLVGSVAHGIQKHIHIHT